MARGGERRQDRRGVQRSDVHVTHDQHARRGLHRRRGTIDGNVDIDIHGVAREARGDTHGIALPDVEHVVRDLRHAPGRVHASVGLGVDHGALLEELCCALVEERPRGVARRARPEHRERSFQGDHHGALQRPQPELPGQQGAAPERDHARRRIRELGLEAIALQGAKRPFAVGLEDLANAAPGRFDDACVEIHERHAGSLGDPGADGRLAHAHEAAEQ